MINYYQQGGAANDQAEDQLLLGAVLGYIGYAESQKQDVSVEDAIAQVANIAAQDQDTLQKLATNEQLVKVGQEKVENENPQILQQIAQPGVLKEIITKQIEQTNVQSARRGAKLNYLMKLKGMCPAGYEPRYYKAGGTICQACVKKQEEREKVQSAKCGKKMRKGAVTKAMNGIRTEMYQKGGAASQRKKSQHKTAEEAYGYTRFEYRPKIDGEYDGEYRVIDRYIVPTKKYGVNDTTYLVKDYPYGQAYSASTTSKIEPERYLASDIRDEISNNKMNYYFTSPHLDWSPSAERIRVPDDITGAGMPAADLDAQHLTPAALDLQNDGNYPVSVGKSIEVPIPGNNMFELRNAKGDVLRRDIIKIGPNEPNDTIFQVIPHFTNGYHAISEPELSSNKKFVNRDRYNNYGRLFNALVKNPKLKTNIK